MMVKAHSLKKYSLKSLDGVIGKVEDFYFDDLHWTVRYLVADTGDWLPGREVLISPYALGKVNQEKRTVEVCLTQKQIEKCPSPGSDKPVSMQYEETYYQYYGWPTYWGGPHKWGHYPYIVRDHEKLKKTGQDKKTWDPHLRSAADLMGHHVLATDGEIGHVEDFIVDDTEWEVRYMLLNTHNWLPGKHVLISPRWIQSVDWPRSRIYVNLTRERIKLSPEYTQLALVNREFEIGLHQHYDREGYWNEELAARDHLI